MENRFRVHEGVNSDITKAKIGQDVYDFVSALNILDLVGERHDIYEKILTATRHFGRIAIGHYDIVIGTREQNNLSNYAIKLGYGLEDLQVVIDEGHSRNASWFSKDSTLFRLYKRDIPQRASGKELSEIGDVLKLFASLR